MENHIDTGKALYREGASHALAGYQLIEELLKTYIGNHFEIARSLLGDRLHFGFTRSDHNQASMGRLLQVFAKICADTQLVNDLRAELSHRNHIAHQSMLLLFSKSELSAEELSTAVSALAERNEHIVSLLSRLNLAHEELISPYQGLTSSGT